MPDEIPLPQQPGVVTEKPVKGINVAGPQRGGGDEKPRTKKEPKRDRPGKILKGPVVAETVNNHVKHSDGGAELREGPPGPAQPDQQERQSNGQLPAVTDEKQNGSMHRFRQLL